ncbi:hypothetical protein [Herbidospora mongoliensis]|uniref:hypothetical protein n=1 Tax=Herbidospora mongoliensis TaxID=688067 RepID=UPI000830F14F|nr:hypothetical protein [Herbidospora mongoliensis]
MRRILTAALAALFTVLLLPGQPASATPIQGYLKWSILLCKLADRPAEQQPPSFFEDLYLPKGAGQGGVHDFFDLQSRGRATMTMSVVKGWFTMPYTYAQVNAANRPRKVDQCLETAKAQGYTPPADHRIAVMLNDPDLESGGDGRGRVVIDSEFFHASGLAVHEMLHSYGYDDSFAKAEDDTANERKLRYADPWDIMTAQTHYAAQTARFGRGLVGFNGPNMDRAGWIPYPRVLTAGQDGRTSMTVRLAPLEQPHLPGTLLVRIPFDPQDLRRYYTVEFRKRIEVSSGIPEGVVALIHEVDKGDKNWRGYQGATMVLMNHDATGRPTSPATEVNANGVTIKIDSVASDHAMVTITTDITTKCIAGHTFRNAVSGDKVCVPMATYYETQSDNQDAPNRVASNGRCILNTVHRLVTPNDTVCVPSVTARQIVLDNQAAPDRTNPAKHFYGPNTCKPGYVWRVADDSDYVCVTQAVHDEAQYANYSALARWTNGPWGPQSCVYGYVWREAFIGDKVCVTVDVRERTRLENETAGDRTVVW